MYQNILKVLQLIERQHDIDIIYACESGSRAWGFESVDSDWDIRFIYKHKLDHYLSVFPPDNGTLDTNNSKIIKDMNKHDLDFCGWDIRKTMFQFSKGNPDLMSWFNSSIIYKETRGSEILDTYSGAFFKSIAANYHYIHMAKGNYTRYIKNPERTLVNTKKYLYVLRPIMACIWIDIKNSIPPVLFSDIYEDPDIIENISIYNIDIDLHHLIYQKIQGTELDNRERNESLDIFIEAMLDKYSKIESKPNIELITKTSINNIFQQFVKGEI